MFPILPFVRGLRDLTAIPYKAQNERSLQITVPARHSLWRRRAAERKENKGLRPFIHYIRV